MSQVSFRYTYHFPGDTKYNDNITQDLPPKRIIGFLEAYKQLMYCLIVFPFYLKYLTNAEYMISIGPIASTYTLKTPPPTSTAFGVSLDRRMLDKMLYVLNKSDMPL